jgi:hypothetical protein
MRVAGRSTRLSDNFSLSLRVLGKERVHYLGPASKICALQPANSRSEVDQPAPGGKIEHSQCTGRSQTSPKGDRDPGTVVHEDEFSAAGRWLQSESDN